MNKVKRFNSEFRGMIEHPEGQFVFAADFYELKAERDALAAENVALRNAHPQPFGLEMMKAIDAYQAKECEVPEQGMMDAFFILRDSIRISQEQTDAYLKSVRAEGVEMFISELDELFKTLKTGGKPWQAVKGIAMRAASFAAKLRAGEPS